MFNFSNFSREIKVVNRRIFTNFEFFAIFSSNQNCKQLSTTKLQFFHDF